VAAFLPISQIFPFLYPTADRYLYFMLPGLLGGALLAGQEAWSRIDAPDTRRFVARAAAICAVAGIAAFGVWSHARAALWTSEDLVLRDAARHFPRGVIGNLLAAERAASQGDVDTAVAALEACRARGWDFYSVLLSHPAFEPVRKTAPFQALIARFADNLIEVKTHRSRMTQIDWLDVAQAYEIRGRREDAATAIEKALALGGPLDAMLRTELARLRATAPAAPASVP
jgi:hypothetical protein